MTYLGSVAITNNCDSCCSKKNLRYFYGIISPRFNVCLCNDCADVIESTFEDPGMTNAMTRQLLKP